MTPPLPLRRCAVYTRKSSEEGLDQAFNSLDAQREAGVAYIQSQAQEGWQLLETAYDDGGYSGATLERPALQQLLTDIRAQRIQVVVVYKVDRLTRSLGDFAKLIDLFDQHEVAFASVTQQFQTTTSMGRLVLNVLLSFAQFEREVTGERIRDKIAASKKKGWWMGGMPPIGYDIQDRHLVINDSQAQVVRKIFQRYLAVGSVSSLVQELRQDGTRTKVYTSRAGHAYGGRPFSRGHLYHLLHNRIYIGEIVHRQEAYPGNHSAILDDDLWQQTQALLKANYQAWHHDAYVRTPFLLKGLLFDAEGNRFSPMQTRKGARTYRYYVNQQVLQFQEMPAHAIRRLPAESLEQAVMKGILEAQKEEEGPQANGSQAKEPNDLGQHSVRKLLTRVEVSADRLRITFNPSGAADQDSSKPVQDVDGEMKEAQARVLEVPWRMTRRGGRTEIQFKGVPAQTTSQPHEGLVLAMVRALQWKDDLVAGRFPTIKALAQRERLARSYVMRVLRLSFLAPDLIDAILNGWQPQGLTLEPFRRPIPLEWAAQRKFFDFPPL
ncbi:MAG: recombinase family protein [Nitrospirales bacterium]